MKDKIEKILIVTLECLVVFLCLLTITIGVAIWWTSGPVLVKLLSSALFIFTGLGFGAGTILMFYYGY